MNIISIYPLGTAGRYFWKPLSYFSSYDLAPGAIVECTLSRKKIIGFVASVASVETQKTTLKKQRYSLKKIDRVVAPTWPLHPYLLQLFTLLSTTYIQPPGAIANLFIPSVLFDIQKEALLPHHHSQSPFYTAESQVIVGSFDERLIKYKHITREAFAKNQSVALFVPTQIVAEYISRMVTDLPKHIVTIHGALSKKILKTHVTQSLMARSSPTLLIGTSLALGCLHGDEQIIIEDANSRHYHKQELPNLPTASAILLFARETQAKCFEGKDFPALEDLASGVPCTYLSSRERPSLIKEMLVDTSQEQSPGRFPIITQEVSYFIRNTTGRILLFTTRKGFYSFIYCTDCGSLLSCVDCKKPLVLYTTLSRYYLCTHCKTQYSHETQCTECHGWNLRGYGIGTERILQEARLSFPGRPSWILDDETAKSRTMRQSITKAFVSSENGICVGTELILEDPELAAQHGVIINLDNLFSIPDFQINERVLALLSKIRSRAEEMLIIQTRFPRHPLFQAFIQKDIKRFLEKELGERKTEHVPPYTVMLKISLHEKNENRFKERIQVVEKTLHPFTGQVSLFPPLIQKIRGEWTYALLGTVPKDYWHTNANELKHALTNHAEEWDIAVNPLSIL